MPPGFVAQAQHFPRRNRIVSGLAQAVVLIEAKLKSGSLITARLALEQGRELFAVPGSPLDPRSAGCNDLIKQGAALAETAEDVISALGVLPLSPPKESKAPPAEEDGSAAGAQEAVLGILNAAPLAMDEILRQSRLSSSALSLALLELELAGRLERHADMTVSLRF